jgi:putative transposase
VGSEGDSYDNALAETINGLKAEVIYRRGPWRSSELVDIPPAKAEEPYYA